MLTSIIDRARARLQALRAPAPLSVLIGRLTWLVPLLVVSVVLAQQVLEHVLTPASDELNIVIETILYGLVSPFIIWTALRWVQQRTALKEATEAGLAHAHTDLERLHRRLAFLLSVTQRLGETTTEAELAALALGVPSEIAPQLLGCALIRFDDHQQPRPVEYHGALDEAALAHWHRHLSTAAVRHSCARCQRRRAAAGEICPLLTELPVPGVGHVVCHPLERNGREYGLLGLFLPAGETLTPEERELLTALFNELAIALENSRLRTRELAALYEISETLQQRVGEDELLARILEQALEAEQAAAGLLLLRGDDGALTTAAAAGEWAEAGRAALAAGLAASCLREGHAEPVTASVTADGAAPLRLLCAPLIVDTTPAGAIVLGSYHPEAFARPRFRLIMAIAGQAALLVQNTHRYAHLEYQAILTERSRLTREMHDGLAQTLGFLKMRANQIARWVEAGQTAPAADALRELARTADEAYLELRATLDGLRARVDDGAGFAAHLRRCVADFESQSGLRVELLAGETEIEPPILVQAHLLRLVQEALANIRKHAHASRVRLTLAAPAGRLRVSIQDDGQGFDSAQALPESRHGLRLMRERASLLGAELEIVSAPSAGTRVTVDVPARPAVFPAPN